MTTTNAWVSVAHTILLCDGEMRLLGQRGGVHFDVVFLGAQKEEALGTIGSHLAEIMKIHTALALVENRIPPKAEDVRQEMRIAGSWVRRTWKDRKGASHERLRLIADGWSFHDRTGALVSGGIFVPEAAPA